MEAIRCPCPSPRAGGNCPAWAAPCSRYRSALSCSGDDLLVASSFEFVTRDDWGARPSRPVDTLDGPASHVVIHHTYLPLVCMTLAACKSAMRAMQTFHQDTNGWADIGYNFVIGGEGRVYEGRGWNIVGTDGIGYNNRSIGIALIGDWRTELPPVAALQAAKDLIREGVNQEYISSEYLLMGHRQTSHTECPGDALFNEIYTWPHFRLTYPFEFVRRSDWEARPSGPVAMLDNPVPYVVIHHTYHPGVCMTLTACKSSMRAMQNFHKDFNGWPDISYNFVVGGEGRVYEGRGWEVEGTHAGEYNDKSVGIALIGDWRTDLPPAVAMQVAKDLINEGVQRGYISPDYTLIGHRQATATECPGDTFFSEISTWPKFRQSSDLFTSDQFSVDAYV